MTEKHFSNAEKHREAVREVGYRRRVFERLVAEKKMRQEVAEHRLAIMEEIARDYQKLAEQDAPEIKFPDSWS